MSGLACEKVSRRMYIAHTAHWQFLGCVMGFLAWILTMATVGIDEWRLWYVHNTSIINSGVAWVGIWRACFYSQVLSESEFCQDISIGDAFVPMEIPVAQVLMMLAVISGLTGNIIGAFAVRLAYFTVENRTNIRPLFLLAGTMYFFTATCSLVPLMWNMNSVLTNSTIDFPPEFHLPAAPASQTVGAAIVVGIFASTLMLLSGLLFFFYRYAWKTLRPKAPKDTGDPLYGPWTQASLEHKSERAKGGNRGRKNPAFHIEEVS